MTMAFIQPGLHVSTDAAEKQGVTYIKDFKLYIAPNSRAPLTWDEKKESKAAKDWFESQNYTMVEGNLNADASGTLKKEVGVYLGYSTTTDRNEAVRDIAVMNERGNYSVGEYEEILKQQASVYMDIVSDMKEMLGEYRTNVKNNVKTAIDAKNFMNTYKEDDSGKLLGDLLMDISDEDLAKLLMQANGQIVLMIQEQLSSACDTATTNWLDRMAKLGSYDKLRKQALKSVGNVTEKANTLLDNKYKNDAIILRDNWQDIRQHITNIREQGKNWGLEEKNDSELEAFFNENKDNSEVTVFLDEYHVLRALGSYPYEDKTLIEYFEQSPDEFKGDGIRKLYPLAASLSDGQLSGIDQSVSIFTLVLNALNSAVVNDNQTGMTQKMLDELGEQDKKDINEAVGAIEKSMEEFEAEKPASIYAGVNRDVFKDSVAVTTTAKNFNNGDGLTWADGFVNSNLARGLSIGAAVGSLACLTGAIITARAAKNLRPEIAQEFFDKFADSKIKDFNNATGQLTTDTMQEWEKAFKKLRNQYKKIKIDEAGEKTMDVFVVYGEQPAETKNAIFEKAMKEEIPIKGATKYRVLTGFKIGLSIACTLLAVADIVVNSIALYKYYNRDHLPIPPIMVDMGNEEDGSTSYVNYNSVKDQKGNPGDVNGDGGKQWLALYQTNDKNAGNPILAPTSGEDSDIIVKYGTDAAQEGDGYAPLHLFGTPNAQQNLTFADGESGWSYNDGKKGIYLYFRRETGVSDEAQSDGATDVSNADAGTSIGGGWITLFGVGCSIVGIIIGLVVGNRRKRKEVEQ